MNISFRSLQNFVSVNSFLLVISLFQYNSILYYESNSSNNSASLFLFCTFCAFIARNYALLSLIHYGTKRKPDINVRVRVNTNELAPKEEYKYEFHVNVATSTMVESITHILIKSNSNMFTPFCGCRLREVISFVPFSFLFEVIFDLFHYWTHRLLHNQHIYKYLHKKHHKFKHPTAITTFYQDPIDLLITNSVPTILSLWAISSLSFPLTYFQFHIITVYKSFVEISGHSGKQMYPTSSFSQCIWFPKLLNIELYTEDHDLHHSLNNCNYSKRFSLWDKVFQTYKTSRS